MSKKKGIAKLLSKDERLLLRRKRVGLRELAEMQVSAISDLFEIDQTRAKEIFDGINPMFFYRNSELGKPISILGENVQAFGVDHGINLSYMGNSNSLASAISLTEATAPIISDVFLKANDFTNANLHGINKDLYGNITLNNVFPAGPKMTLDAISGGILPNNASSINVLLNSNYLASESQSLISSVYVNNLGGPPIISSEYYSQGTSPVNIWGTGQQIPTSYLMPFQPIEPMLKGTDLLKVNSLNMLNGSIYLREYNEGSVLASDRYSSLGIASHSYEMANGLRSTAIYNPLISMAGTEALLTTQYAEQSLARVDWNNLGRESEASQLIRSATRHTFMDFTKGFGEVTKSMEQRPNWVFDAPGLIEVPSLAFYTQSRLVELVSVQDVDQFEVTVKDQEIDGEEEEKLKKLLHRLDPALIVMWEGAVDALYGSNPDYKRHFMTSLRELHSHVLRMLSPESEFAKWDVNRDHYHNDRPTRKGRYLYLNRNLMGSKKEFSTMMDREIANSEQLFDMLNGGTHGITTRLTKNQLVALKIKGCAMLTSMMEIEFSINRVN